LKKEATSSSETLGTFTISTWFNTQNRGLCENPKSRFNDFPHSSLCYRYPYEHGNELAGSMKGGKFLELLSDC